MQPCLAPKAVPFEPRLTSKLYSRTVNTGTNSANSIPYGNHNDNGVVWQMNEEEEEKEGEEKKNSNSLIKVKV